MARYIVGESRHGLDGIKLDELNCTTEDIVVVVLNKSSEEEIYKMLPKLRAGLNRGIQFRIVRENCGHLGDIVGSLCMQYGCYDIYDTDVVDDEYIEEVCNRKVVKTEAEMFCKKDIEFVDIDIIIAGLAALVQDNDVDGIKMFIENNSSSVRGFVGTIEYIKSALSSAEHLAAEELGELRDKLNDIENERSKLLEDKVGKTAEINDYIEKLTKKDEVIKEVNEELERIKKEAQANGGKLITSYSTTVVSGNCKAENILYFKVASETRYFNTLITATMYMLKVAKKSARLLIYDDSSVAEAKYVNIAKVDGKKFREMSNTNINDIDKFVITEPAPNILNTLLNTSEVATDVVIIIDRLQCSKDLISGTIVDKWVVLDSTHSYNALAGIYGIKAVDRLVTSNVYAKFNGHTGIILRIPHIEDYVIHDGRSEDTVASMKYKGCKVKVDNETMPIINYLLAQSNIKIG